MTTGDSSSSSPSGSTHSEDNSRDQSPHSNNGVGKGPGVVDLMSIALSPESLSLPISSSSSSAPKLKKLMEVETTVVQVANIAPQATRDQMAALFGYIGKVEDVRLYPTMDIAMLYSSKICFVKFRDPMSVSVAQHLTNTVFVDRALIVIPFTEGEIPDENMGLELLNSGSILPGIADPKLPQHVTSQLDGKHPNQVVVTNDPKLVENELPLYPTLPPSYDSRRIDEIRRTVMVADLDPEISALELMDFFNSAGEVKYVRLCTRDNDPLRYALIEFTEQPAILAALKLNGAQLGSKTIKVYHSTQAIVKPQAKTNEAAQKEIEEAMTRQAQNLLSQGLDVSSKEKRRSRSPSRGQLIRAGPRRSRTRSPRRRSRSRSKRRRSRTRTPPPRRIRRSRSRSSGRVLRSPWRRRSRSKSKEKRRSSSHSRRVKRSNSRDRDRKREKKSKKDKDRDKERDKEGSSKDHEKNEKNKAVPSKEKGKENGVKSSEDVKKIETEKKREKDRDRKREKRKSPSKSPIREKRRSTSRERRKRSKSKKKKRNGSDREDSADGRSSIEKEPQPLNVD